MNFMGIGAPEMMIIAVIALLVFGPQRLPEVMGQAGKMVRDFRRMSAELGGEFEKTIAEARDATSGLTAELGGMSKEVSSITNSVKKDLGVKGRSTSGAKGTTTAGKSTVSKAAIGKPSTVSKSSTSSSAKTAAKAGTSVSSSTSKSTVAKKPVTPVATREDPLADVFLFEAKPVERVTRSRKAVPSVISDLTPRVSDIPDSEFASFLGDTPAAETVPVDAISRARQRRRNAGYGHISA